MIYKMVEAFKKVVFCGFLGLIAFVSSCKTDTAEAEGNDQKRTDSILNVIQLPELKALNQKILDNPNDAGLYHERARLYLKLKLLEDAIYDVKRSIRVDSNKVEFYLTQADIYFAANETRNAKDVLEKVVRKFPTNTEGLLKLSELFFIVKQYENAFTKINEALKIDQNLSKAYFLKGDIYKETGDTAKAISSYETAIEQDNQNSGAFFSLGLIYSSRKSPLAFDYYDNVLRLKPNNVEALYAKGKLLQDLGRFDESIGIYKSLLKVDSLHPFALYNLGAIDLEVKKDAKSALSFFSQALNADPKYAEAYYARGVCYEELKDVSNAKADYQMCLQLKPNYEPAVEALNSLGDK